MSSLSDKTEALERQAHKELQAGNFEHQAVWYKGLDFVYRGCNSHASLLLCVRKQDLLNDSDENMPWAMCQIRFQQQDQHAMDGFILDTVDPIRLGNGTTTVVVNRKVPVLDAHSKEVIGVRGITSHPPESLKRNFMQLHKRDLMVSPSINVSSYQLFSAKNDLNKITDSEFRVLFYLLRGRNTRTIAEILTKSTRTVEFHISNLFNKCTCHGIQELIELAECQGYRQLIPRSELAKLKLPEYQFWSSI